MFYAVIHGTCTPGGLALHTVIVIKAPFQRRLVFEVDPDASQYTAD